MLNNCRMTLFGKVAKWLRWCPRWGVSASVVALILWLTLAPDPVGDADLPLFPGADKIVHAVMFGFLTLTLWFDSGRGKPLWRPAQPAVAMLFAGGSALFGLLIEWLQLHMDMGRSFEWWDAGADASGCLLVWIMIALTEK